MARTKTVEVRVVDRNEVVRAMSRAGVNLTDAELDLLKARIDEGGDPVAVFEGLLDERVGPACRQMSETPYPAVKDVLDLPDLPVEGEVDLIIGSDEEDSSG